MKIRRLLMPLILLIVLTLTFGCQSRLINQPADKTPSPLARFFAKVPPKHIDDTLTDEQLQKMALPIDQIPMPDISDLLDPNVSSSLQCADLPQTLDLKSAKAYLQAKNLIAEERYEEAKKVIVQAAKDQSGSFALQQLLAQTALQLNDVPLAEKAAQQSVLLDPNNLIAWQNLAAIFQKQNKNLSAAAIFRHALNSPDATFGNPVTAILHLQLASTLMQLDYYSAAIEEYQKAVPLLENQAVYAQSHPLMEQLVHQVHLPLLTLASLQVQTGNMDLALNDLRHAQQMLSPDIDLLQAFVMSLTSQRVALRIRYQRIIAFCRYLLAAMPDQEYAIGLFHQACQALAKHNDYIDQLKQWHAVPINNQSLLSARHYAFGLCLAQQYDLAVDILQKQLRQKNVDPDIYLDLADISARKKNWLDMVQQLFKWCDARPDVLPEVLKRLQKYAGQIPDLNEKINLWSQDPVLCESHLGAFILAVLAQDADQYDLAERFYQQAITQQPDFAPAFDRLIELLIRQKKFDQAITLIENRRPDFKTDPKRLSLAADAHAGLGHFQQAQEYYQKIIERQPNNLDAYLSLGDILIRQNLFQQAENIYLHMLDDWPDQVDIYRRLFILYAVWNAMPDLDETLAVATQRSARNMFVRWLAQKQQETKQNNTNMSLVSAFWQHAAGTLEPLAVNHPNGKIIQILYAELQASQDNFPRAVEVLEHLVSLFPDDEHILMLAAEFNQKNNNITRAAEIRYRLAELNPDNPKCLIDYLKTARLAGQAEQALDRLIQAARRPAFKTVTAVHLLRDEARHLFMMTRQYDRAVEYFQKVYWLALNPGDLPEQHPDLDDVIGATADNVLWALTHAECFDRAILHAVDFYRRYPEKSMQSILQLIHTLNVYLLYDKTLLLITRCLDVNNNSDVFYLERFMTMIQSDQIPQAVAEVQNWFDQKPNDQNRKKILLLILSRAEHYDQAIRFIQGQIAENPDPELTFQLAEVFCLAGRYDQAEQLLIQFKADKKYEPRLLELRIKLNIVQDNCSVALIRLGEFAEGKVEPGLIDQFKIDILTACGQTEKAAELVKKTIDKKPDDLNAQLRYVVLLEQMGQIDLAVSHLDSLLQKMPDNPVIKNNLGYTLIEHNRTPERAEKLLLESYQAEPYAASTLDSLGWFYYKVGKFEPALDYLRQAAAGMIKTDYEVWEHLGDTCYRLNLLNYAEKYWKNAQNDLNDRINSEKTLVEHKARIDKKLEDFGAGRNPQLAPLFSGKIE